MDTVMTIICVVLLVATVTYHYGRIIWAYWSTRKINNNCIVMVGTKPVSGCKVVKFQREGVNYILWNDLVKKQIAKYNPRAWRPLFIQVTEEDFSYAVKQVICLDYSPAPTARYHHRESGGPIIFRGLFQKAPTGRYGFIGDTEECTSKTELPKPLRLRPEVLVIALVLLGIVLLDVSRYLGIVAFVIYLVYGFLTDKE